MRLENFYYSLIQFVTDYYKDRTSHQSPASLSPPIKLDANALESVLTNLIKSLSSDRKNMLEYTIHSIIQIKQTFEKERPLTPSELATLKSEISQLLIDFQSLLVASKSSKVLVNGTKQKGLLTTLNTFCASGSIIHEVIFTRNDLDYTADKSSYVKFADGLCNEYQVQCYEQQEILKAQTPVPDYVVQPEYQKEQSHVKKRLGEVEKELEFIKQQLSSNLEDRQELEVKLKQQAQLIQELSKQLEEVKVDNAGLLKQVGIQPKLSAEEIRSLRETIQKPLEKMLKREISTRVNEAISKYEDEPQEGSDNTYGFLGRW